MQLKEIYDRIDALAPFALSQEFIARGHHDNSGIIVDQGRDIVKMLCSLDLTAAAVDRAVEVGANCIFTHHPAIFYGVKCFAPCDPVLMCIRAGISVISAHLNLDAAEGGIDDGLMEGLGGKKAAAYEEELSCGAYGRAYDVPPIDLYNFVENVKKTFSTDKVIAYGDGEVRRVASFCGAGLDENAVAFAAENGADTVVSSDAKHHILLDAIARGMKVVLLPHYASENYGFIKFIKRLSGTLGIPAETFTDVRFL